MRISPKLVSSIITHAWYIRPGSLIEGILLEYCGAKGAGSLEIREEALPAIEARPERDVNGDALPRAKLTQSGVAIVPIVGPMMKGATGSDKYRASLCSPEDIASDVMAAMDARAKGIAFPVNSPGGTAVGCHELASLIAEVSKQVPTLMYTEDQCCSAAEYVTSACSVRVSTPSAVLGSIGTMCGVLDVSRLLDRFGVSFDIYRSGRYKGMGHPAKPLSSDQAEFVQRWVNARAAEFKAQMVNYRGLDEEHMQGQIFVGSEAAKIGLTDFTVSSLREAIAFLE